MVVPGVGVVAGVDGAEPAPPGVAGAVRRGTSGVIDLGSGAKVGSVENGPVVEGRRCVEPWPCDKKLVAALPAVVDRLASGIPCGTTTPLTARVVAITEATVATTKMRERMR